MLHKITRAKVHTIMEFALELSDTTHHIYVSLKDSGSKMLLLVENPDREAGSTYQTEIGTWATFDISRPIIKEVLAKSLDLSPQTALQLLRSLGELGLPITEDNETNMEVH